MVMRSSARRWTREEIMALPDDGRRYELIDGELVVTPAPGAPHQSVLVALVRRLLPYLSDSRSGTLLWSPADLSFEANEILQPDLFVLPRPSEGVVRDWRQVTSLLVAIEVLSPSTARHDRGLKQERWRPDDTRPDVLDETLAWSPAPGVPPLLVNLPELFTEALGAPA